MRKMVLGAIIGAALVAALAGAWNHGDIAFAQRPAMSQDWSVESGMMALPGAAADGGQLVVLIDPKLRAMAVYHIDRNDGRIKLASVRNIQWDLRMLQLNSEKPLPEEIQSLLEHK